jgi:hypothetical protein
MKYIKTYNKIYEVKGDILSDDDKYLNLLNDLSFFISDLGFNVHIKGYESYTDGYNTYDVIIESNDGFVVYNINSENIENLDSINFDKIEDLNNECKNLIKRAIDNDMHLVSYEINTKNDGVWCFIRFSAIK